MASAKESVEQESLEEPKILLHRWVISFHAVPGGPDILNESILAQKSMDKAFDIDEADEYGCSALHLAVQIQNLDLVKVLVNHGANIHLKNVKGFTPLFHATGTCANHGIAQFLIKEGARVKDRTPHLVTPLHGAVLTGDKDVVKLLLDHGADPSACAKDGTRPLDLASDQEIKTLLHKKNRKQEKMMERKSGVACAACGVSDVPLKRCSQCQVTFYCSKECQRKDWHNHKKQCDTGVFAHPPRGLPPDFLCTFFGNRLGAVSPNISVHTRTVADTIQSTKSAPVGKRFLVKVQRPLDAVASQDLMVYNVDKSVVALIYQETSGHDKLYKKIVEHGFLGAKAYFWAEKVTQGEENGPLLRVFPGKMAPVQTW